MQEYLERTSRNHFWLGGPKGQNILKSLTIGVAGAGGIGSNVAVYLARLGIGSLKIADPDTIDRSNLNRQSVARIDTLGKPKVLALADDLKKIDPEIGIEIFPSGITSDSAEAFVRGCDIIVDEIDPYPVGAHVALQKAARNAGIDCYSAFAIGLGVHLYRFTPQSQSYESFITSENRFPLSETGSGEQLLAAYIPKNHPYLNGKVLEKFGDEIAAVRVPILGGTALLAHAAICLRILNDIILTRLPESDFSRQLQPTPIMPSYLAIDLISGKFEEYRSNV